MTTTIPTTDLLTEELLARFDERAPVYDREHRFFQEYFGYTAAPDPVWPDSPAAEAIGTLRRG